MLTVAFSRCRARRAIHPLNVIAGWKEMAPLLVRDRNIRHQAFDQGGLPDLLFGLERITDLTLIFRASKETPAYGTMTCAWT